MRINFFIILFLLSNITLLAQTNKTSKLNASLELKNITENIDDGTAIVNPTGGVSPYQIKWSNQNTPLNSNKSTGLREGQKYSVIISDANGDSVIREIVVPINSIDEKINSTFVPIVNVISKVLMVDIFAALNLYDPTMRNDDGTILRYPNGDPKKMSIPFIVIWLSLGAIYFTIQMKFINIRGFKHAIDLVKGKYDDPNDKGEVSHFQALTTALSATVGLGNIAGVAIAISLGGPGATFWMIVAGLLGMSSKFVECTLGVKYREIDKDGNVSGGPMYYLSKALKKKKMGGLGKVLAVIFAFLTIGGSLGGGNMFQANQAFSQVALMIPEIKEFGAYFGVGMAIIVAFVIIGGIKSIAKVTEKIVPFMAILYVATALVIIFMNITETGTALKLIFDGAFSPSALKGGIVGVLIIGVRRAVFSNEAGIGSASIAHAAVKTTEPVSEGIVALLEPFIDTVIICTMTALVIIFTGFHNPEVANGMQGSELTSVAFGSVFSWFPYLLVIAIFLFALSTMISWSYYGLKGFNFLFGSYMKNINVTKNMPLSNLIYSIIFLIFIVIGASSSLGSVIDFSDMMILSMAFPNILGLIILTPEVKNDLASYFNRIKSMKHKQ